MNVRVEECISMIQNCNGGVQESDMIHKIVAPMWTAKCFDENDRVPVASLTYHYLDTPGPIQYCLESEVVNGNDVVIQVPVGGNFQSITFTRDSRFMTGILYR